MRSFVRSRGCWDSLSQSHDGVCPGRTSVEIASSLSCPPSGDASQRMRARVDAMSDLMCESLGTAASTLSAGTEYVRKRLRTRFDTPSRILSLRIRLYSSTYPKVRSSIGSKNTFFPMSSRRIGVFTMVSCTLDSAGK